MSTKDDMEKGLEALDKLQKELSKEMNKSLFKEGRDKAVEDIEEKVAEIINFSSVDRIKDSDEIEKSVFSSGRFEVKLITNEPAYYPIEIIDNSGAPFRKPVQINMRISDAEELILKLQKAVMDGKFLAKLDSKQMEEL